MKGTKETVLFILKIDHTISQNLSTLQINCHTLIIQPLDLLFTLFPSHVKLLTTEPRQEPRRPNNTMTRNRWSKRILGECLPDSASGARASNHRRNVAVSCDLALRYAGACCPNAELEVCGGFCDCFCFWVFGGGDERLEKCHSLGEGREGGRS